MFGKKKKDTTPIPQSTPTPEPPQKVFNKTEVILTLWDGTKMDTTISCSANVSLPEMMKQIIRDGVFDENCEKILRVNEIRVKKPKESEENEVMN